MAETLTHQHSTLTHPDSHAPGHGHTHSPERPPGASEAGTVAVEIGPGFGAAVIRTPAGMDGLELEIRPAGAPWHGVHTAVRERRSATQSQYAAVFGSLHHGVYELRVKGSAREEPVVTMEITESTIRDLHWPMPG